MPLFHTHKGFRVWWGLGPRDQPAQALYSYLLTWLQILSCLLGGQVGSSHRIPFFGSVLQAM